jgi:hypothetical protein
MLTDLRFVRKDQPVTDVRSLEEHIHSTTEQRHFDTLLVASFVPCYWRQSGCTQFCRTR